MRNYSYIGISLVILIFGIIVIPEIVDRVGNDTVVDSNRSDSREDTKGQGHALAYVEVDGEKKKVPEFSFIDQNKDTITSADYNGKVYLVEFFFTTCPTICPVMNQNLVKVQEHFSGNADFGIASFSIDPVHDTPAVLKDYAESTGITHPNWHLMTGEREAIYKLANAGFNIYAGENAEAKGGFEHSGYFALVDQDGYIRSRRDRFGNPIIYYRGSIEKGKSVGFGQETPQIDILIEDIKKLLNNADKA